ncbi:MAG: AbgT family transporter [Gammaproteobacteria bacterium]
METQLNKTVWFMRLLNGVQELGNRLPHPTALFFYLCLLMLLTSFLAHALGVTVTHPNTNEIIHANSLLSSDGLRYLLTHSIQNFTQFAPLGAVLVAMLGIGLADRSGFLNALMRATVQHTRTGWLSYGVVCGGVLSNLAADAGYVVYIPLCAMVFLGAGRHPLAGIAAAFAGVSGGYSANLIVGPADVILSGLTQEAGRLLTPDLVVLPTNNYWFLCASTVLIVFIGGFITDYLVEPFLRSTPSPLAQVNTKTNTNTKETTHPDPTSSRALRLALGSVALYGLCIALAAWPQNSPLRHPDTHNLLQSPLISGIVIVIAVGFAIAGMVYGRSTGVFRHSADWVEALESTFKQLASYLVLMFFAAQFVAWFNWSQLGPILAIQGARQLAATGIPPVGLLIGVVLITAILNLFIGSASAKWALLAPIFVPLLMQLGIDPNWTQIAYRVGDSSTNIITPLMPYFALVLGFAQQHDPQIQFGRLIAMMLPYTLGFLLLWIALLITWWIFGLPLGV